MAVNERVKENTTATPPESESSHTPKQDQATKPKPKDVRVKSSTRGTDLTTAVREGGFYEFGTK